MVPHAGALIGGDFKLVSQIGQGGMGEVWIAEQISVGRRRALKLMRHEMVGDAKLRERFVQEARIGATIDSEHVVEVVAAGIDGVPWLAMELLDGKDLGATITERGALPITEIAEIAEQLCHALAAAHRAGVVHRDLKPENVFLARSRRSAGPPVEVKVLDFGLAKLAEDARLTTGSSGIFGTPLYMAPEQTDSGHRAAPTLDVWALGLIVYRMLTGRYFWRSAREGMPSITALMREVLFEPIAPASVRVAEDALPIALPPDFDPWLARCLERDPADRFADADAAFAALARVLRGAAPPVASTEAPPPSRAPAPSRPILRRSPSLTFEHTHEDMKFARAADVVIVRWKRTPTAESVAELDRALGRALRDSRGEVLIIPVVDASVPPPGKAARDALADMVERHDALIRAVAYAVLGSGFSAAALRAVITSLSFVARPRTPTKVFATIPEALRWLVAQRAPSSEVRPTGAELAAIIERFCAI